MMKHGTDTQSTTGESSLNDSCAFEAATALHSEANMNRPGWHRPRLQRLRVSVDTAGGTGSLDDGAVLGQCC